MYRIYVDLPDAENRLKILKIFLTPENLETGFEFEKLAKETEGYSGSDLKVWSFTSFEYDDATLENYSSSNSFWFLHCRIYA